MKGIVGFDKGLKSQIETAKLLALRDIPILITGETGTGKEVFARAIHELSPRKDKPFVAVNCGGIPESLIDSELFGYTKGSFTGAGSDYKGKFEQANGGTIFLDEIGELPFEVQARLLRVLQERSIDRIGGSAPVHIDFRLIAATNRDLEKMIREGKFREDLYFRIKGAGLPLPPLRERKQDIVELTYFFMEKRSAEFGIDCPDPAEGELGRLIGYSWPGNIRELQNTVDESLAMYKGGKLFFTLPSIRLESAEAADSSSPTAGSTALKLDELLRGYFTELLRMTGNRIAGPRGAAEIAGINANTLRAKLRKLGIPFRKKDI